MRTPFALLLFVSAALLCSQAKAADYSNVDAMNQCTSILKERTAAMVARDWGHLQRLAGQYLSTCKSTVDREAYSNAFVHLAIANLELKNIAGAIAASDSCIAAYYANSDCHIYRLHALIALARMSEARKAYSVAERLVEYSIEKSERGLRDTSSELERHFHIAQLENLNAQKSLLDALRRRYFSE